MGQIKALVISGAIAVVLIFAPIFGAFQDPSLFGDFWDGIWAAFQAYLQAIQAGLSSIG